MNGAPGMPSAFRDPTEAILPGGLAPSPAFGATSRYRGLPLATVEVGGRQVRYVTRRFVPAPERFAQIGEHVVADGERPDTLAALHVGDPEQFWRLCDANRVLHPDELAVVGRRVRIVLPEGVPPAADD